ncbi:MAG: DUF559 domain-containing protein [Ignavibacteria bacterium]|nr:DUF559 domain-containing protein [Ignavibacteria bacterium]
MKADKQNNFIYNKSLIPFSRKLKKNMTKSEAVLWKYGLKNSNILGYKFRRQRPILNYIADFVCLELKLIIELDGITHTGKEKTEKDFKRQKELEEAGFKVIRFSDEDVLNNVYLVTERIKFIAREIIN